MPRFIPILAISGLLLGDVVSAQDFHGPVKRLLKEACVQCHDSTSDRLDLTKMKFDVGTPETFRQWERIFHRVEREEMPPATEERPHSKILDPALKALKQTLQATSLAQQERDGRVILRRLNRTEYNYTLKDLLGFSTDLSDSIPVENVSTGFDTVFSNQGLSPLHIESFLKAADSAMTSVIELGRKPKSKLKRFEYKQQEGVRRHLQKDKRKIVRELEDAIVMFSNASYIYKVHGLNLEHSGRYRIRAEAYGYQTQKPVILTLNAGNYKRGQTRVLGFFDLQPDTPRVVEVEATLQHGEYLFPGAEDLTIQPNGKNIWGVGAEDYSAAGIALKWIEVEGPLESEWPPPRTTQFLPNIEIRERKQVQWINNKHEQYELVAGPNPQEQIRNVIKNFAPRAVRRPVSQAEIDAFAKLGTDALEQGRSFRDAIAIAGRAVLTSPAFLFHASPAGTLNDYALAARLSYFLWKSIPDRELTELAATGRLHDSTVLRAQVERMLNDPKSERFVRDFANQWLRLADIDATSPDDRLYPEYEELLKLSMQGETYAFITHMLQNNLSTRFLIDSDFAMLNRRLAQHYDIPDVSGQTFRKVKLPQDSPRGGLITQAAILKVTANGTVTSPVKRGSWVLTHLLGEPPSPPPPGIGSIEPDTRGTTTIRETLNKHRNDQSCAACHQLIDPPGFALECFDVIGGFRTNYRSQGKGERSQEKLLGRNIWEYKIGKPVDSSGRLSDGSRFKDVQEFKQLLMRRHDQVARNVIEQLTVYATGAEIQFADHEVIDEIWNKSRDQEFGIRTMIHEIVQSRIFRNK